MTKSKKDISEKLGGEFFMKNNQLLYILLVIASFFLGYYYAKTQYLEAKPNTAGTENQANVTPQAQQPPAKVDVGVGHLPVLGNKDAKVTVIEFTDFQCPFCRKLWKDSYAQIKKDYIDTGKIKYAFRHAPLPFHTGAIPAALSIECANEQGKAWEMRNKIFEEQDKKGEGTIEYTNDDLKIWASDLDLDTDKFNQCLDSEKYKNLVEKDTKEGQAAGVNGTPSTFVNGKILVGAQPYTSFKEAIDKELK